MKNLFSWIVKRTKNPRRRRERWAEASEVKKQVNLILKQLNVENAAMDALIQQLSSIVTRQVHAGEEASSLAGHAHKRMAMKGGLFMIKRYCNCILHHLPLLAEERSFAALPLVVQEAVAGLMFASRRLDSPELGTTMARLSEVFKKRYAPEGGEGERVIEARVDERMRNEYYSEEELSDEVKERLGRLIASKCDMGLKFQLQGSSYDEDKYQCRERFKDRERKEKMSEGLVLKPYWIFDESDDEEVLSNEEKKEVKLEGLVLDPSWVRDFESYRTGTVYLGHD